MSLFDPEAARIALEQGMAAADEHADMGWKIAALIAVQSVALRYRRFTADEVWQELESSPESTHQRSAMGGIFTQAEGLGWIRKTDDRRQTQIPRRHRDLKVWESLIYGTQPVSPSPEPSPEPEPRPEPTQVDGLTERNDMPLKIKRAGADEYGRTLKLLLAGDPGSGKTRLASTFPNVFYANADAGMMSVVDRQPPFVDVDSTETLTQLLQALRQTPKQRQQILGAPVSTVVVDTVDSIQKILIEERKKEQKKDALAISDWGWLGDQLRVLIRNFRNLDMNVIFTVHLKAVEDSESGQTFIKPGLQGQMGDEIAAYFDVCGLLKASPITVVKDGRQTRVLQRLMQTGPDARHPWLKDRSGKLPVDFDIDLTTDGPKLLKVVFGGAPAAPSEVTEAKVARTEPETTLRSSRPHPTEAEPQPEVKAEEPEEVSPPAGQPEPEPEPVAVQPAGDVEISLQHASNDDDGFELEPEPVIEAAEGVVAAAESGNGQVVHEAPATDMICDECGDLIESEDQRDLSLIRFRKRLDRKCFLSAKKAKA
jgi:hypothetical protein